MHTRSRELEGSLEQARPFSYTKSRRSTLRPPWKDVHDIPQGVDVAGRVSIDYEQISELAGHDGADLVIDPA